MLFEEYLKTPSNLKRLFHRKKNISFYLLVPIPRLWWFLGTSASLISKVGLSGGVRLWSRPGWLLCQAVRQIAYIWALDWAPEHLWALEHDPWLHTSARFRYVSTHKTYHPLELIKELTHSYICGSSSSFSEFVWFIIGRCSLCGISIVRGVFSFSGSYK